MIIRLATIFILILVSSCGFKVLNSGIDYKITEIITSGDKRINYFLKNKLLLNSKSNSENLLKLTVNTKKSENIQEKNISNQITKYEIKISSEVQIENLKNKKSYNFTINQSGSYNVGTRHSETINNEKDLANVLIDSVFNEIFDNLINILNDL